MEKESRGPEAVVNRGRPRRAVALTVVIGLAAGVVFCGGGGCGGSHPRAAEPKVVVAAAADLRYALEDLRKEFRGRHPEIEVEANYGSSGSFYAQLKNRAPFDVFLSADTEFPRRLADQGLATPKGIFVYAVGHLVVWVRKQSPLDVENRGLRVLLDPSVEDVALANPRFAPYGRAAEAALRKTQLYDRVRDKLRLGNNVAQAAHYVHRGVADVGLISLAQAMGPPLRRRGRFYRVPQQYYPRIAQGGVILSWAQDPTAAAAFRAFLLGAGGRAVLKRYGFTFPE
jgi:molybdate transport system substrate-binding protein